MWTSNTVNKSFKRSETFILYTESLEQSQKTQMDFKAHFH